MMFADAGAYISGRRTCSTTTVDNVTLLQPPAKGRHARRYEGQTMIYDMEDLLRAPIELDGDLFPTTGNRKRAGSPRL